MDFRNFIDDQILTESLNSPQEFYMTDDTKLPMQLHAAFSIDGDENSMYVISLVQSKTAGMYILDVGRTPKGGGKSYYWKFHSPSDLRPVLSTLVKFVETSMQMLGPKLKGIAVRFRMANTKMMEVSERIATKMIKKSYMKSMKIVPVKQPEVEAKKSKAGEKGVFYGKTQRYLFITKKIVAPATIFKAKNFKTLGYDFDLSKGLTPKNPLPYETLAELKPKVVVKPVKSVTPSKKYAVAGLNVKLTNDDIVDVIGGVNTKDTVIINHDDEKAKEVEKATELVSTNDDIDNEWISIDATEDTLDWIEKPATMPQKIAAIVRISKFNNMVAKLHQHGFSEDKFSESNLKYVMESGGGLTSTQTITLKHVGLDPDLTDLDAWREVMKAIGSYSSNISMEKQNAKPIKKMGEWFASDNAKKLDNIMPTTAISTDFLAGHTIKKSTTLTAEALQDTINDDPFGEIALPGKIHRKQWYQEDVPARDVKVESFLMDHFGDAMKKMPLSQVKAIHSYSSGSSDVNNKLRKIYERVAESKGEKVFMDGDIASLTPKAVEINNHETVDKCQNLLQCLEDLPTTPENMWVYRGTDAPYDPPLGVTRAQFRENLVPGEMYWDGAFMSTSIKANIDFASQIRFRFYLPKGTPVIPLLTDQYSPMFPNERELILPPGSTFKIIERNAKDPWETSDQDTPIYITAVYIGSVHHDVREKAKTLMYQ